MKIRELYEFKTIFLFLICLTFISCQFNKHDPALHQALELAGENREELEKVLKHYEEDSLKLEAAKFLISNMPIYNTFEGQSLDNFKREFTNTIENGFTGKEALDKTEKITGFPDLNRLNLIKDIEIIKASYLIENIEHSFMVWNEQPWGKYISFEDFCEYILPYRIENEPVENWKAKYYTKYQPILDSLLQNDNVIDAANIIYDYIVKDSWSFILEMPEPHMGAIFLFDKRVGSCRDRCDLAIYIMRSLGIPVGTDMVLHSPDQGNRHFWNFVLDNNSESVEFTLWEEPPVPNYNTELEKKRGKVYRNDFSYKKETLYLLQSEKRTPGLLSKLNLRDVSEQYFEGNNISFEGKKIDEKRNGVLYLCVFDIHGWVPIDWGKVSNGKLILKNIEDNVLFSICSFEEGKMNPIYYPFIVNNNSKQYFTPSLKTQTVHLERKYTMKFMKEHMKRFSGGLFEGSNKSDFSSPHIFYMIDSISSARYYSIEIDLDEKFRFIRYNSPDNSLCNMAELSFYDEHGEEMKGDIIGSDGAIFNEEKLNKHAVFDKDPLTFFNAPDMTGMWVGMDFKQPRKISRISFLPRNDDNFIKEDELYELFFASDTGWKSLGTKIGTSSQVLIYEEVPINTIFWLRNLTEGKEERPFSYEDGQQKWW